MKVNITVEGRHTPGGIEIEIAPSTTLQELLELLISGMMFPAGSWGPCAGSPEIYGVLINNVFFSTRKKMDVLIQADDQIIILSPLGGG